MQRGVVDVLKECGETNIAEKVAGIPTMGYLSGMQAVTTSIDGQYLIPAGPVEIIATGGISHEDFDAIEKMNLFDAHLASLCDTVVDIIPQVGRAAPWKKQLFTEMYHRLIHRTICKSYSIIK